MIQIRQITVLISSLLIAFGVIENAFSLEVSQDEYEAINQYRELKKTDRSAAKLRLIAALERHRTPIILYEAALMEVELENHPTALLYFDEILKIDSDFVGVFKNKGQIEAALGDPSSAIKSLLKGIEKEGIDKQTIKLIGQCYTDLNKHAAAETALRWGLLYAPEDVVSYQLLAANMLEQKRFEEARVLSETAIKMGARDIATWMIRINTALQRERYEDAIVWLEMARLALDDPPPDILSTLGKLYLQAGMTHEAGNILQEAHARKPMRPEEIKMCIEAFIAEQDAESAGKFANLLLKAVPDAPSTMFYCACAAKLSGDVDKARHYAEEAVRLDSGYGDGYLLLAKLYADKGDFELALDAVRTARSFKDVEVQALNLELEMWMRKENWTESLATLDILSERDPDNNWAEIVDSINDYIDINP